MIVHTLFPRTVCFFDLGRNLTKKEINFIMKQKQRPNDGNSTSVNTSLLENKTLEKLKTFISNSFNNYAENVLRIKKDVSLDITQSWANFTKKGEFHHRHSHSNSYLSGVFYVKADDKLDKIMFFKDGYDQIKLEPKDFNIHNSESWFFNVKSNQFAVFPSSLTHMVPATETEERVSISCNTFPKGMFGDTSKLTGLEL
jgi:uncharacterized protein (TIGR02466 family)|tara:strand:- start:464 stop:1060 length:597 start_codon:yes stop_codon:yes gene_type:complete